MRIKEKPFFTIITIVLNGEEFIERAIQSVINQTIKDYEYIIIDGGSVDGTLAILEKYKEDIDIIISEPDRGISHAFNKGIELASGEFIAFINSDDYFVESCLEIVAGCYRRNPNYEVFCGAVDFYDGGQFLVKTHSFPEKIKAESSIHQSSCFIKRTVFDTHLPFNEELKYAMDYEFFLRLYIEKVKYYATSQTLSRRDVNGLTGKHSFKAFKELKYIRSLYFGPIDVFFNYYFFLFKLFWGRVLRKYFLPLYRFYWWFVSTH
jgi:glycosyltransferase involved in cell wall biosynthesis